jgi:putative ABC transport system permease protein
VTGGWGLALRNLSRNRRRSLVTATAIAIGYAAIVVLGGYANRVETLLRTMSVYLQHGGHLAVYARGGLERAESKPSAYALDAASAAKIEAALRADPRVELTGRYLTGGGLAGNGCGTAPFRAIGLDMEAERRIVSHPEVLRWAPELVRPRAGRALADVDPALAPVTLGVRLARSLGKEPGPGDAPPAGDVAPLDCDAPDLRDRLRADPFVQLAARTHDGSFGATDTWLVGIYQAGQTEADKSAVTAPLEVLQRVYDTDRVSYVAAYLRDPRDVAAVARAASDRLAAAGLQVAIYRFDDAKVNPYYVGTVGFIGALVSFIGLVVATVVALSVLNAMTLAILERTRELGTFRALGFTRRQLLGLFLREATALSAIALAAGLALGLAVSAGVNAAGLQFEPPGVGGKIPFVLVPDAAVCVAGAVLLAALALAAAFLAVRRRVRAPVAALVTEVMA